MRPVDAGLGCWIDGRKAGSEEARVHLDDPAVQAGWGVFETLAVRGGEALDPGPHLQRLREGAARLSIPLAPIEELEETVAHAAAGAGECAWLKIVVVGSGRSFVFAGPMDPAYDGRPASAVLLPWRRNAQDALAGLKTLNYAANRMGRAWAAERGADEGLWLNARGHLTEGCSSNLFVVEGRKLFTAAAADGILPGIVRGQVLGAARDLGVAIHEGKLRLRRLERAREAFLTSSLGGVRPLVRYAGRVLASGEAGPLTRKLAERVALARTGGSSTRT